MTVALIDADIICYQALHSSTVEFDDGDAIAHSELEKKIREIAQTWTKGARCQSSIMVLSDPEHNWRYALRKQGTYKDDRDTTKKDTVVEAMIRARQFIKDNFKHDQRTALEGDDLLGILHTGKLAKKSVIVSIDKDMQTIPGKLFNPNKMKRPMTVTSAFARRYWMTQALTGDTVDGYKGAPGIGPKKAEAALQGKVTIDQLWPAVVETFESVGATKEDALFNARVARILHSGEYDADKGAVKLFNGLERGVWLPIEEKKMQRPK